MKFPKNANLIKMGCEKKLKKLAQSTAHSISIGYSYWFAIRNTGGIFPAVECERTAPEKEREKTRGILRFFKVFKTPKCWPSNVKTLSKRKARRRRRANGKNIEKLMISLFAN